MKNLNIQRVLCFGETLWDCYPNVKFPGGAPFNAAVHLKKMGVEVDMISRVGIDDMGTKLLKAIQNKGLSTELIQFDTNLQTGRVEVDLKNKESAKYNIIYPVAWDNIQYNEVLADQLKQYNVVIYGSLVARSEASRHAMMLLLEDSSLVKVFDVNLRPPHFSIELVNTLLNKADLIKMNEEELNLICEWHRVKGDIHVQIQFISDYYQAPNVCVTKGSNGAMAYIDGKLFIQPGINIKMVDSIGAGDAFLASYINSLRQNMSIPDALQMACATGAFIASKEGATPDYEMADIIELIKNV